MAFLLNNKTFSTLFTVDHGKSKDHFNDEIRLFNLERYVSFRSIDENYQQLQQSNWVVPHLKGPDDSLIVDVPGAGDCWLSALLAPLLGFVPDTNDSQGILLQTRRRLCEVVKNDPRRFEPIFGSMQGLEEWCASVIQRRQWDGSDAFQVFAEVTNICVHVIYEERSDVESVRHHVSSSLAESDWDTSIVVMYGHSHFRAVDTPKIANLFDTV